MYLQVTNLNTAGGGLPILTGPGFVDTDERRRGRGAGGQPAPADADRMTRVTRSREGRTALPLTLDHGEVTWLKS